MRYESYYGMKKLSRPMMVVVTSLCLFLAATVMPETKMHASISEGEMLTALTDVKGSAGYVAIERVTGTLHAVAQQSARTFRS